MYLKNLADGVIILDHSGTIMEANPSAISLLGLADDFVGKKYADIISSSENSGNDAFHQVIVDSVLEAPKTCRKKVSYQNSDGTARLFHLTSSLFEEDGKNRRLNHHLYGYYRNYKIDGAS